MLHEMMHALGFWHEQVDLLHSAVHILIGLYAIGPSRCNRGYDAGFSLTLGFPESHFNPKRGYTVVIVVSTYYTY